MVWHLKVPRVLLLYWDESPASQLHHMTIKTFKHFNPDWSIKLYRPVKKSTKKTWTTNEQKIEYTGHDYWPNILTEPGIEIIDIDFETIGFSNNAPEVIKSDFLRLHLLATCGGVWSDMDIFYLQPMEELECNSPENSNYTEFIVHHSRGNYYPIGFLMSSGNSQVFKMLRDKAKTISTFKDYQIIGALLYTSTFPSPSLLPQSVYIIKMNAVYPFTWNKTRMLVENDTSKNHLLLTRHTIGLHWYNGDPIIRNYQNNPVNTECLLYKLVDAFTE